jgi:Zn-dependent protease with chaperone function
MSCIGVVTAAAAVLTGLILWAGTLRAHNTPNVARVHPHFTLQAQSACETAMLGDIGAREVFSGKPYETLKAVAKAYGRAMPHVYVFPASLNMAYIAGSASVDGRGKIVVGQQAIDEFDSASLKGFFGHEMAHLVSDDAQQGCSDYMLRNPQTELEADALAARTLGSAPVKAFLQRVVVLTKGENWEAKQRIAALQ